MALSWRQANVARPRGRDNHEWIEGDIAFLRPHQEFEERDFKALIRSRQLQKGATGHPVIILRRPSPTAAHVLVTPVSAYSSGPDNDFLPPWKQRKHRSKAMYDFRAISGSVRPRNEHAHLFLETGSMPKPKASWVYIQNVYIVPVSTLKLFDKPLNGTVLRIEHNSLADLLKHISQRNPKAKILLNDPRVRPEPPTSNAGTLVTNSQGVSDSSSVWLRQDEWGFLNNNNDIIEESPKFMPMSPSTTTDTTFLDTSMTTSISSLATSLTSVSINDACDTEQFGTQQPAAKANPLPQLEIPVPKPATYKDALKGSLTSQPRSQPLPPIKPRAPKLALRRTTPIRA